MIGKRITAAALGWLGTPYQSNAMVKGIGVDCAHLLVGVLLDAKLIKPNDIEIEYYSNEWHLHRSEEKFLKYVKKVAYPVAEPQEGDFLLYQYGRCISHGGIYMGNNQVLHSYLDMGVILSRIDDVIFYDGKGSSRLRGIWRFKGVR